MRIPKEKTEELLNSYKKWILKNKNELKFIEDSISRDQYLLKESILNKDFLSTADSNQFYIETKKYIGRLSGPVGIRLGEPRIKNNEENLKKALNLIIDTKDGIDPIEKASDIIFGENKIKCFASAFWTPLFHALYPNEFPNLNNKTKAFFYKIGIKLTSRKYPKVERIRVVIDTFKEMLSVDPTLDFYKLDHLMHYAISIEEGSKLMSRLFGGGDNILDQLKIKIHKYVQIRMEHDPGKWDEAYKWDLIPKIAQEVKINEIDQSNVITKLKTLSKRNPQHGSFCHWSSIDDAIKSAQIDAKKTSELISYLFDEAEEITSRIEEFISGIKEINPQSNIGTPFIGYLYAIYDINKYPLFKGDRFELIKKELDYVEEWKGYTPAEKYEKFTDLCLMVGEYIRTQTNLKEIEVNDITIPVGITALDGQDFFYIMFRENIDELEKGDKKVKMPKNLILYGPPGTGKTYRTIDYALNIIHRDNNYSKSIKRDELITEFKKLQKTCQIQFITFHQSYSYEEFIEGIRPVLSSDQVKYKLEDGIFKKMANLANSESTFTEVSFQGKFEEIEFFKMSLGDITDIEGTEIYEYCIKNNCISMGWGGAIDYSKIAGRDPKYNSKEWKELWAEIDKLYYSTQLKDEITSYGKQAIYRFANWLKNGDIVFISEGNRKIRAIGKIVGNYEYREDAAIRYNHFRKVEWLVKNVSIPIERISSTYFSQQTIHHLNKDNLKINEIKEILKINSPEDPKNYVLIIDEINRGNISKIFGELITLIEEDKRIKSENEINLTLPYSGDEFGVPQNLFIVGTMNTADRSIALLDVALRRRFKFVKMRPEYELLENKIIDGVDLSALLKKINERIEVTIDEDHMIGHSYFMNVVNKETLWSAWYNDVIPLLEEYFYQDWTKMKSILGEFKGETGFIETASESNLKERFIETDSEEYLDVNVGRVKRYEPDDLLESLKMIYE